MSEQLSTTTTTKIQASFTMEHLRAYLYGNKKVQLIDTTKLQKERIKHLHINKEPKGNSWCDICNESPEECPMHGPLHSLRKLVNQSQIDSPIDYSAILKFPDEVGLCTSSIPGIEYGVCAKAAIPSGTWIGPYEGRLVRPEQIKQGTETEYMWEIFHDGQVSHYLDARDESNSSWMRFIRCARHRFEQNMVIFQYHGCIYYRTTKDVKVNEELLVWYDSRYSMIFGIPVALNETGSRGVNPPKGIVTHERTFGKRRKSNTELPKVKRTIMDKDCTTASTTIDKSSAPMSTPMDKTSTQVVKQEPNGTAENIPSSALNYRNSMYHRGRWYTLPDNERSFELPTHCTKCMKAFNNRETFLLHNCSKTTNNYTCAYCDRTCATLTELGKHMEDHVNDRPFKCGYCPRSFNNAIALNLHVRIHGRHVSPKILHTQTTDKSRA